MNGFRKEYITGRKDQFDLAYALFRKAMENCSNKEEMVDYLREKFEYVMAKMASERAKDLMEELELM